MIQTYIRYNISRTSGRRSEILAGETSQRGVKGIDSDHRRNPANGSGNDEIRTVFGRTLKVTVRPMLLDVCPVCNVGVLWSNGRMDQDATWYGGTPRPRRHCVRWGIISPIRKWAQQPSPTFRPMSIVTKRSPNSATAELLFIF